MNESNFSIDALPERIPEAIEAISQIGTLMGLAPQACFEIQVALTEALNNIVEHALAGSHRQCITIACRKSDEYFEVSMTDHGRPISDHPAYEFPDEDKESGRGWPIIFNWTDHVEYNHDRGRNHLTLKKRLAPGT